MIAVRGLRTRLMVAYALFFAIFLTGLAAVFRARLESTLDTQAQDKLNEEWASLKGGILRIDTGPEEGPRKGPERRQLVLRRGRPGRKNRSSSTSRKSFSSPTGMAT
jgi:hypothetical protein